MICNKCNDEVIVWLFVLAEFCRRCETKGTWRGVGSRVQGQSTWEGQWEPHEAVDFLALKLPQEKANALSGCYFVNCSRAVRLRKGVRVLFCCLRTGHDPRVDKWTWTYPRRRKTRLWQSCTTWCANATDLIWKFHLDLLLALMDCSCHCTCICYHKICTQ